MSESQRGPARPSLSPALWLALACWAGVAAGTECAGRALQACAPAWIPVVVASALAVAACRVRGGKAGRALRALALAGVAGAVVGTAHVSWLAGCVADAGHQPCSWGGETVCDAVTSCGAPSVAVRVASGPLAGSIVDVEMPQGIAPPRAGVRLDVRGRVRGTDALSRGWLDAVRRGHVLRCRPWKVSVTGWAPGPAGVLGRWRARALDAIGTYSGSGADVVRAAALGDRAAVSGSAVEDDFRSCGLAFALVLSGVHVAVAAELAARACRGLGLPRPAQVAVCVAVAASAMVACGPRASLARAVIAFAVTRAAGAMGRRSDTSGALAVAIACVVLGEPGAAFDAGLGLGVCAVIGIVALGPLARWWAAALLPRGWRWVAGAAGTALAAQCGSAPVAASAFGAVSPWAPLVALAMLPVIQATVLLACLGTMVLPLAPVLARAGFSCAVAAGSVAAAIARSGAVLPGAALLATLPAWVSWVLWVASLAALWACWPLPRSTHGARAAAAAIAVLAAIAAWPGVPGDSVLTVLDVGQGDAVLVRDGPEAILVDAGPDPAALRRALGRVGVADIQGVVLTHAHDDHTGGLRGLAGVCRPRWIGVPDVRDGVEGEAGPGPRVAGSLSRVPRVRLAAGMRWTVGAWSVRVLWPKAGMRALETNDTSVVLLLERGDRRALLLGDAEERAQRGAADVYDGPVDVMKVAHHGSVNGVPDAPLHAWRPRVALVSVGEDNPFGHPMPRAMAALQAAGAQVWRTDRSGDLAVRGRDGAWTVSCSGPGPSHRYATIGKAWRAGRAEAPDRTRTDRWPRQTWQSSRASTSSTGARTCSSIARSSGCVTGWLRSPTWTSTWTPSRPRSPPWTTSSRPRTRCPSCRTRGSWSSAA